MALADEMLALARRAGDEGLELQARTRRIVDLAELGDGPAFDAELDAYAAAAARSRLATFAWYVPVWRSVRAFLAGRPEEGHDLRRRAFELGTRVGDPNAQFVRLADINQRLADGDIRFDLYGEWHAERMRTSPVAWAYRSMYAWMLAASGREEEARDEVADQRRRGMPQSWPRDTNWLSAVKEMTEAAYLLGDRELGAELEELLQPFADRMAVAARAMNWMGSIAGALALMAELRGDPAAAAIRYRRAIELRSTPGCRSGPATTGCGWPGRCARPVRRRRRARCSPTPCPRRAACRCSTSPSRPGAEGVTRRRPSATGARQATAPASGAPCAVPLGPRLRLGRAGGEHGHHRRRLRPASRNVRASRR